MSGMFFRLWGQFKPDPILIDVFEYSNGCNAVQKNIFCEGSAIYKPVSVLGRRMGSIYIIIIIIFI